MPECYFLRKKFELATKEPLNPIKQDDSSGHLASFKKGDIYFNYGCFPRHALARS